MVERFVCQTHERSDKMKEEDSAVFKTIVISVICSGITAFFLAVLPMWKECIAVRGDMWSTAEAVVDRRLTSPDSLETIQESVRQIVQQSGLHTCEPCRGFGDRSNGVLLWSEIPVIIVGKVKEEKKICEMKAGEYGFTSSSALFRYDDKRIIDQMLWVYPEEEAHCHMRITRTELGFVVESAK